MQLKVLVSQFTEILEKCSDSPKLDAELLLCAWLKKPRSFLHAYPEHDVLPDPPLLKWLYRRQAGEPVAYILGVKAFWDLDLSVTPDVLIPRPETECLVEWMLDQFDAAPRRCADLGTGSGAIACVLAQERPAWQIQATDQSSAALIVAEQNAEKYRLHNIAFHQGDWCEALVGDDFDLIVSNPPYIDHNDSAVEPAVRQYEPASALFADQQGLADIAAIVEQSKLRLKSGGCLVIEHGYQQALQVQALLTAANYVAIEGHTDLGGLSRFTTGELPE